MSDRISRPFHRNRLKHFLTSFFICFLLLTWFSRSLISEQKLFSQNNDNDDDDINGKSLNQSLSEVFLLRQSRMEHICYKLLTQDLTFSAELRKNMKRVYVLTEGPVAWCPIFKAASTTIIKGLTDIWNQTKVSKRRKKYVNPGMTSLGILSAIAPQLTSIKFNEFQSENGTSTFMVSRHPFHRLVSAFRDKLERLHITNVDEYKTDFYYKKYGAKIVSTYRKMSIKKFGENYFDEKNHFGAPVPPKGLRIKELPTFWEFVQFVRNERVIDMDEHWTPVSTHCASCSIHYDFVIRFENFENEMNFLWNKLGQKVQENQWSLPDHTFEENEELTKIYFSILSDEEILDLFDIYKRDFQIFGYNFQFRNITISPEVP